MKTIKLLSVAAFALGSFLLNSCGCCTGEDPVPPLRSIPEMKELPGATEAPATTEAPETADAPILNEK
jgi:hypothetical protein